MSIQDLTTNLDFKQNLNIYATCKQLDTLNLILTIYDNSIQANLTGYTVRLKAMKSDNIPLIQEHVGVTISSNVVTIVTNEQLTTTSGKTLIELQFINKTTGLKKATFNLVLNVVPSTLEVNATISTATYTLLQELENKLDQAGSFLENITEAIEANDNLVATLATAIATNSDLEANITTANTLIASGTALNDSLNENIIEGTTLDGELDAANTLATSNIAAMGSFGDVTVLAQTVAEHTTELSEKANPSLLTNGDFQVYQRSATGTFTNPTSGTYTYDRWRADISGNNTFTKLTKGIRWIATGEGRLRQLFEDIECNKLLGKTVTLSAKFKGTLELQFSDFGSNAILVSSGIITNNDFDIKSITINIPTVVGGRLGVYLHNTSSSADIEWVKLELGDKATPFVPRLYGEELALCQRYYLFQRFQGIASSTTNIYANQVFTVPMRANPTVTIIENGIKSNSDNTTVSTVGATMTLADNGVSFVGIAMITAVVLGGVYRWTANLDAEIY